MIELERVEDLASFDLLDDVVVSWHNVLFLRFSFSAVSKRKASSLRNICPNMTYLYHILLNTQKVIKRLDNGCETWKKCHEYDNIRVWLNGF